MKREKRRPVLADVQVDTAVSKVRCMSVSSGKGKYGKASHYNIVRRQQEKNPEGEENLIVILRKNLKTFNVAGE